LRFAALLFSMSDEKTAKGDDDSVLEADECGLDNKTQAEIEHEQEVQLRAKFPTVKGPGTSVFLQKRLSKGTKYFDSGDYNMAKAKVGGSTMMSSKLLQQNATADASRHRPLAPTTEPMTGDAIPTPETVPQRKASLQQSKLVSTS
jgi:hypothetical protein